MDSRSHNKGLVTMVSDLILDSPRQTGADFSKWLMLCKDGTFMEQLTD
jgi:hypothetical protein